MIPAPTPHPGRLAAGAGVPEAMSEGDESGVTIVEVLIAMFVLAIGILSLISVATSSLASVARSEARQDAYTAATRSIEAVRAYSWDGTALHPDDPLTAGYTSLDPSNGTIDAPGTGETVLFASSGEVTGFPHQYDDGRLRVRTFVTSHFDDPEDPQGEERRVTVLVEFERAGTTETVRQSTLLTRARWGVAQPAFSVSPVDAVLEIQRTTPDCFVHTVINRGLPDRYRFEVPTVDLTPADYAQIEVQVITDDGTHAIDWNDPESPNHFTPPMEFEEEFLAVICYRTDSGVDDYLDGVITIVSELRPEANQDLLHTVLLEFDRTLYLRGGDAGDFEPSQAYRLSTDDPTALLPADFDGDGRAGLTLGVGDEVRWRADFDRLRTIVASTLDLATSTPDAVDGSLSNTQYQRFVLELRRIAADGSSTTLVSEELEVSQSSNGWSFHTIDLGPDSAPADGWTIEAGDELELAVRCEEHDYYGEQEPDPEVEPESPPDCVIGLNATFAGITGGTTPRLQVDFP